MVMLGLATVASAVSVAFDPVGPTPYGTGIAVTPGVPTEVLVKIAENASIGGMDLFVTVPPTVTVSDATCRNIGGVYNGTNSPGESIDLSDPLHAQLYAYASTTIAATAGQVLAKFNVTIPENTPIGTKIHIENSWDGSAGSLGGSDMPIVGVDLIATPEPATALLLLGALPLLRRRRA